MKMPYKKDLIRLLEKKRLHITDHRLAILSFLSRIREPVMVHKLVTSLQKRYDIDQATVYRNLSMLSEAGVVRRLDFNHGHAHYELSKGGASYNVVCGSCETIEKLDGLPVDEVVRKLAKKSKKFKHITTRAIEMYGICRNCG